MYWLPCWPLYWFEGSEGNWLEGSWAAGGSFTMLPSIPWPLLPLAGSAGVLGVSQAPPELPGADVVGGAATFPSLVVGVLHSIAFASL